MGDAHIITTFNSWLMWHEISLQIIGLTAVYVVIATYFSRYAKMRAGLMVLKHNVANRTKA